MVSSNILPPKCKHGIGSFAIVCCPRYPTKSCHQLAGSYHFDLYPKTPLWEHSSKSSNGCVAGPHHFTQKIATRATPATTWGRRCSDRLRAALLSSAAHVGRVPRSDTGAGRVVAGVGHGGSNADGRGVSLSKLIDNAEVVSGGALSVLRDSIFWKGECLIDVWLEHRNIAKCMAHTDSGHSQETQSFFSLRWIFFGMLRRAPLIEGTAFNTRYHSMKRTPEKPWDDQTTLGRTGGYCLLAYTHTHQAGISGVLLVLHGVPWSFRHTKQWAQVEISSNTRCFWADDICRSTVTGCCSAWAHAFARSFWMRTRLATRHRSDTDFDQWVLWRIPVCVSCQRSVEQHT